jgi:predicted nucleic acid-binding Zn ribbon protein
MTSLLHLLPQMLRHAGESEEARQQAVFAGWAAAVGSQVRKVTAPVRLERKTLIVAVPDSTWRTQLKRMSGQVLFRLNSLLGAPAITSIEFVINEELVLSTHTPPQQITFNAPDQQAILLREEADRIPDPEMRATFLRAAGKCLDRRAR